MMSFEWFLDSDDPQPLEGGMSPIPVSLKKLSTKRIEKNDDEAMTFQDLRRQVLTQPIYIQSGSIDDRTDKPAPDAVNLRVVLENEYGAQFPQDSDSVESEEKMAFIQEHCLERLKQTGKEKGSKGDLASREIARRLNQYNLLEIDGIHSLLMSRDDQFPIQMKDTEWTLGFLENGAFEIRIKKRAEASSRYDREDESMERFETQSGEPGYLWMEYTVHAEPQTDFSYHYSLTHLKYETNVEAVACRLPSVICDQKSRVISLFKNLGQTIIDEREKKILDGFILELEKNLQNFESASSYYHHFSIQLFHLFNQIQLQNCPHLFAAILWRQGDLTKIFYSNEMAFNQKFEPVWQQIKKSFEILEQKYQPQYFKEADKRCQGEENFYQNVIQVMGSYGHSFTFFKHHQADALSLCEKAKEWQRQEGVSIGNDESQERQLLQLEDAIFRLKQMLLEIQNKCQDALPKMASFVHNCLYLHQRGMEQLVVLESKKEALQMRISSLESQALVKLSPSEKHATKEGRSSPGIPSEEVPIETDQKGEDLGDTSTKCSR